MNENALEHTFAVGLNLPVSLLQPVEPLTGLALTREGILTLCTGSVGLAVELDAEGLRWLARMMAGFAEKLESGSAELREKFGIMSGQAGHA